MDKYNNVRDRYAGGHDVGQIVDGVVTFDERLGRFVLIDEDGVGFDLQATLQALVGKQVRLTLISFESLDELESMFVAAQGGRSE